MEYHETTSGTWKTIWIFFHSYPNEKMTTWYSRNGEQQFGPYSDQELKRAVEAGKIMPETLIRQGENGNWFRADQIPGLLPMRQTQATPSRIGESPGKGATDSLRLVLFDCGFTTFLARKLISLLWLAWCLLGTITALYWMQKIFSQREFNDYWYIYIVGVLLLWTVYLLLGRILFEILIVIFKIEKHLRDILNKR